METYPTVAWQPSSLLKRSLVWPNALTKKASLAAATEGLSFTAFVEKCVMSADLDVVVSKLCHGFRASGDDPTESVLLWEDEADGLVEEIAQRYAAKEYDIDSIIAACLPEDVLNT